MNPDQINTIFNINNQHGFDDAALQIFNYQAENNLVYKDFITRLGRKISEIDSPDKIPFIPVEFFKGHKIVTGNLNAQKIFESSRTTGTAVSRHHVVDIHLYEESFLRGFRYFYGEPADYFIAALLPSYTERDNSSLVYMMDKLIKMSRYSQSGFFRDNTSVMINEIEKAVRQGTKVLLVGVSFALLEMAEKCEADLSGIILMETGGMKGRRKEITRHELHSILKKRFNLEAIHSEYGMTELLSQAYSRGEGLFRSPPWMRVILRDTQDPLSLISDYGRSGGINIIDLANVHSCSFIATSDLGKTHADGSFEVLGRFDNSDVRGCNLLSE